MPTLLEYTNRLSDKLGGHSSGVVAIDPDPSDALAQRSVISADIFDAEKDAKSYGGRWLWVGKYHNQRRVRSQGYTTINYVVYTPPETGTYFLKIYGWGTTKVLGARSPASAVTSAIKALDPEYFEFVEVTGSGPFTIKLPSDPLDIEPSAGEVNSAGGLARLEMTSSFSKALRAGDNFDIHTKLPVLNADEYTGLHSHINTALRKMWFRDLFPVSPNQSGIYTRDSMFWVRHPEQIEAIMGPAAWKYTATLTPPITGTFVISMTLIDATVTTASIDAETMDSSTINAAINTAFTLAGKENPFTVVTDSVAPWITTLTIPQTFFAAHRTTVTGGVVTEQRDMLSDPSMISFSPRFLEDAPTFHLMAQEYGGGSSFYIYGLRSGDTWVAPQASYGVTSENWQDTQNGLLNDYDQGWIDLDELTTITYWLATTHLATNGPQGETAYWKDEAQRAAIAAAHVAMYENVPESEKPLRGRRRWGGKLAIWSPGW